MRAKHALGYWLEDDEMQKHAMSLLSENMKWWARKTGLSNRKLGKFIADKEGLSEPVDKSQISKYANGIRWPDGNRLTYIAEFYGIQVYELFLTEKPEPTADQLLKAAGLRLEKIKPQTDSKIVSDFISEIK